MSTGNSESYDTCIDFLRNLVQRGLPVPLSITTDGAPGVIKAVDNLWPKSLRIRCWFHKMQNLRGKVAPEAWETFKSFVIDIRDAPNFEQAKNRLNALCQRYEKDFPEACRCLREDMDASLNHLNLPVRHQQQVRTTNLVERSFVEERRRTKTIPHLWNENCLEKLVFSVMIRVSDRWARPQYSQIEKQQIKKLRKKLNLDIAPVETNKKSSAKRRSAAVIAH
jgi:transposase-like protein